MKIVPQSMQGGAMTLSRCWRIYRRDEQVIAFTDHDCDLSYSGITHRAIQGLESTAHESLLGFSTVGSEASGILKAPGLIEVDIINGLYDGARVEVDLVDWQDPRSHIRLETGLIGEITRSGSSFTTEIRSLTSVLDEERGRLFRPSCSAELGDGLCKVDLDDSRYNFETTVTASDGYRSLSLNSSFDAEKYNGGTIKFLSGNNAGDQAEIRIQQRLSVGVTFILWRPTPGRIFSNDRVKLIAGCNKEFSTCRAVFNNVKNFRGFPHMPGNDFIISVAADGSSGMDGGSLFN